LTGTSALGCACKNGHVPIVRELLTRESRFASSRLTAALEEAVEHRRHKVVDLILETVASPKDLAPVLSKALKKPPRSRGPLPSKLPSKKRVMDIILEFIPAELLGNAAIEFDAND
jgi:hypothetical protein